MAIARDIWNAERKPLGYLDPGRPWERGGPSAFVPNSGWQVSGDSGVESEYAQNNPEAYFKETGATPQQLFTGNIWNPESRSFEPPQTAELKQNRLMDLTGMKTAADIEKARMSADSRIGAAEIGLQGRQYAADAATERQAAAQPFKDARLGRMLGDKDREFGHKLFQDHEKRPETEFYTKIAPAWDRIESVMNYAKANPNKQNLTAIDQALITTFNKLTDPSSVVRESEYARFQELAPIINKYQGYYERIMKGGAPITQAERVELYNVSKELAKASENAYLKIYDMDKGRVSGYGLDPALVLPPRPRLFKEDGGTPPAAAATPAPQAPPAQGAAPAGAAAAAPTEGAIRQSTTDPSKSFIFKGGKWQIR